ncbi:MAG TPA: hypothetical protein V6D17_12275 [Candidatus Obscuribacterales bacterium]
MMMNAIELDDGRLIGPQAPVDELLSVLVGHLAGAYSLSDEQVFSVKSWLLIDAQKFPPGQIVTAEEKANPFFPSSPENLWAIVGKTPNGEAIVWHRSLPWPEGISPFFQ